MKVRSFTIYDIFKRNAKIYKNQTAIQTEGQRITFGELFDQVNILAGSLNRKGVKKGDRIAVLAKNYPQYLTLMGGIAAIGAIMVPINFRLSTDEVGYNLTNTEPVMIFVDPDFEKTISDLQPICPWVRDYVTFGPGGEKFKPFDSLLGGQPVKVIDLDGDDPYIIMHTAAVQGNPRGAIISHHNLIACSIQGIGLFGFSPEDSYLNILPLFHIAGMMAALTIMHVGGRNLIMSKYDPKVALKTIYEEKVTVIGDFPPILLQLLDEAAKGRGEKRLPGEGDLRGLGRGDLPAVPDIPRGGFGVGRDDDLIGRLDLAAFRVPVDPEEARLGHVDAHGILEVFAAQRCRGRGPSVLGKKGSCRASENGNRTEDS